MLHLCVERVDAFEAALILQTEHKYDGIHPVRELKEKVYSSRLGIISPVMASFKVTLPTRPTYTHCVRPPAITTLADHAVPAV